MLADFIELNLIAKLNRFQFMTHASSEMQMDNSVTKFGGFEKIARAPYYSGVNHCRKTHSCGTYLG